MGLNPAISTCLWCPVKTGFLLISTGVLKLRFANLLSNKNSLSCQFVYHNRHCCSSCIKKKQWVQLLGMCGNMPCFVTFAAGQVVPVYSKTSGTFRHSINAHWLSSYLFVQEITTELQCLKKKKKCASLCLSVHANLDLLHFCPEFSTLLANSMSCQYIWE